MNGTGSMTVTAASGPDLPSLYAAFQAAKQRSVLLFGDYQESRVAGGGNAMTASGFSAYYQANMAAEQAWLAYQSAEQDWLLQLGRFADVGLGQQPAAPGT